MASRMFTNADLDKSTRPPSKSRTYTNADLPQQEDDFVPDDDFIPDDFTPDVPDKSEIEFQDWYAQQAKLHGLNPNPEGQFYDYRKAFGARAQPDKTGHWPSEFKLPGHPNEFVGGFSTITGEPNRNQRQETDVNKLVEQGYDPEMARALIDKNTYKGPSTFSEGVLNSLRPGGTVDQGMLSDVANYIKGGTIDIPQTAWDMLKGAGNTFLGKMTGDSSGLELNNPGMGIDLNPNTFARQMGQAALQPLVTAGIGKYGPGIANATLGLPIEYAGKAMKKFTPISNMTPVAGALGGGIPGGFAGLTARAMLRSAERGLGKKVESLGQKMRVNGKTVELFKEPKVVDVKPSASNSPETTFKVEPAEPVKTPYKQYLDDLDAYSSVAETGSQPAIINGLQKIAKSVSSGEKMKIRLNRDGSFTDMSTGEVFGKNGKPLETSKPDIMDLYPADGANRLIKEGKELLNKNYSPETPTKFHPAPEWPEGTKKQRLHELMDKSNAGTLTVDELVEARVLDKQLRNHDINPTNPNLPRPMGKTYEPKINKIADSLSKDSSFFKKNQHPLDIKGEKGTLSMFGESDPRTKLTAGPTGESGRTFLRNFKSRVNRAVKGDPLTEAEIPANAHDFFDEHLAPARVKQIRREIDNAIEEFSTGQWAKSNVPGQVEELKSALEWAKQYANQLDDPSIPVRKKYFNAIKDILDFKID